MAFGAGDNDVPMFECAGASFAMAHGWPSALQTATPPLNPPLPSDSNSRRVPSGA
jgi:hydroxymethylpyrimidine pyrophosphatase-like HAD family hydrolase